MACKGLKNVKLVHEAPQIFLMLAFFQRKPGNLLSLRGIITDNLKNGVETITVSLFMSEYIAFKIFVKIFLLHDPIGF